ncbi:MAG: hypothetical protein K9I69_04360 [Ignavibacteriales bacterium]|nr:hypothetical protein [Ignavibacteriales bacterium]MCF8306667.1 hypothetical protein [Ignavibacteriales bacterium]MCF8316233.1 hypothetical protein [Ignavibacteriales bacterium]MCF8437817.1 hypothetical protein [Ignavibacteriales bacterium]
MNSKNNFRDSEERPNSISRNLSILFLCASFIWPWIVVATGDGIKLQDISTIAALSMLSSIIIGTIISLLATRKSNKYYRAGVGFALAGAFIMNWAIPAVGIIGAEGDTADLMYFGVQLIGITSALYYRFQPRGMSFTMTAMTVSLILVIAIAFLLGRHNSPVSSVGEILMVNCFFAIFWIPSALFFRSAAKIGNKN